MTIFLNLSSAFSFADSPFSYSSFSSSSSSLLQTRSNNNNNSTTSINDDSTKIGNCTIFNWDYIGPIIDKYPPRKITNETICPNKHNRSTKQVNGEDSGGGEDDEDNDPCLIKSKGTHEFTSTMEYNGPIDIGTTDYISLIRKTIDRDNMLSYGFNQQVTMSMDNNNAKSKSKSSSSSNSNSSKKGYKTRINPGQKAYLQFVGYKVCYTGTVENCTGFSTSSSSSKAIKNGTNVKFCVPFFHPLEHEHDDDVTVTGKYSVVYLDDGNNSTGNGNGNGTRPRPSGPVPLPTGPGPSSSGNSSGSHHSEGVSLRSNGMYALGTFIGIALVVMVI